MSCILMLLWLPLLALGGFLGFMIGTAVGGDGAGLVGGLLGVIASHLIQWALWGDRSSHTVPPPWWNR